jgi:hypothetical protein
MVLDAGRVKHFADLMHRSIASNGSAVASNWRLSADGLTNVIWTPESAGGSVADILDLPTAETDTTLVLAPDGAGGVEFRAETGSGGGGGGLSQSFVGYNTIGGTWTATVGNRHYMKKITLAADSLLASIDVYLRSNTDAITGVSAILTTDAAGVPDHLILAPAGRADPMVFQETNAGAQPGRWVSFPVGRWLTAGDYWIGFQCAGAGVDVANDASGSDVYWTSGGAYASGTYYNSAKTTGTVKYSIRGSIHTGGAGGPTIQYPALKPATPTYDFAGASLDGAFSAHSSQGSFATTDCKTQGEDWIGSAVELQYSGQMGALYVSHSNTDFDFTVGGIREKGLATTAGIAVMAGIAALDSAGTGVGLLVYNDGTMYLATVTTWNYVSNSDNWSLHGMSTNAGLGGDWWMRLKRVSGTWTAYASQSGRAWDKVFNTRADSITVDRLCFGLFYNTATAFNGRLTADYFQVDV